jgi:hypothetical protein
VTSTSREQRPWLREMTLFEELIPQPEATRGYEIVTILPFAKIGIFKNSSPANQKNNSGLRISNS